VVSGIQWVPADATHSMPAGAQPANAVGVNFVWILFCIHCPKIHNQGVRCIVEPRLLVWKRPESSQGMVSDYNVVDVVPLKVSTHGRQKEEEKRRKREEKEAAKRLREKEDSELRRARERDSYAQERRKSFNAGTAAPGIDPGYPSLRSGYGTNPHNSYSPAGSSADLDRRFEEMGLRDEDKHRKLKDLVRYPAHEGNSTGGSSYSNVYNPSHHSSTNPTYPPATRPPVYSSTGATYGPSSRGPSPNMRPVDIPRSTTPVPGTMAGTSITGFPQATIPGHGGSPFTTPGGFPAEQQQLPAPDAFSRPVNAAQPYTPFETIKIQNMDDFVDKMPKMPLVLQPHDVYHEDWIRFMEVCIKSTPYNS
jgi:hypothetical protein